MKRKTRRLFRKSHQKTAAQIETIIRTAARDLFKKQPNIFKFTEATGQTEWNLGHHLAFELKSFFPNYDCDLDVSKHNQGNRRPDIIFHSRGEFIHDFLVVEIKFNGGDRDHQQDKAKIVGWWFGPELNYKYGAVVNLRSNKTFEVRVMSNENWAAHIQNMVSRR